MQKFLLLIIITLFLIACKKEEKMPDITEAINEELTLHPKATLLDLYKNFFQGKFGPGHMIASKEAALSYLNEELSEAVEFDSVLFQPVGYEKRFYRVNLSLIKDSLIGIDELLDAFVSGQENPENVSPEEWKTEWHSILGIIEKMNPDIPDFENDRQHIEDNLSKGIVVGHHSEIYMKTYNPHYRIVPEKEYIKLKKKIDRYN